MLQLSHAAARFRPLKAVPEMVRRFHHTWHIPKNVLAFVQSVMRVTPSSSLHIAASGVCGYAVGTTRSIRRDALVTI